MLLNEEDKDQLISRFQEYVEYDDVRYIYMLTALEIVKTKVRL